MDFDFSKNLDEFSLNHYCPVNTVKFRPILSLKKYSVFLKWGQLAFIQNLKKCNFARQNFPRHGEVSFLRQWVSATSSGLGETVLLRLAGFLLAMAKYLCPELPPFWKSSPFISPWRSISPWPSLWRGSLELSRSARLLARHGKISRHGHLCGEAAWGSLEVLAF